jgi:hypothetical protein
MLASCGVDDLHDIVEVVVGESEVGGVLDKAELNAENRVAPELDVSADDIEAAVHEAEEELS